MLEYYITDTSVSIELTYLNNGDRVTGLTPTVTIRNNDTGNYFDFNTNAFAAAPTSATAVLTSALDGIYAYAWDVSAQFNTSTYLTYEFHNGTALATDDVIFRRDPLVTGDVTVYGARGGLMVLTGVFAKKEKKKLFDKLEDLVELLKQLLDDSSINNLMGNDIKSTITKIGDQVFEIEKENKEVEFVQKFIKETEGELRKVDEYL